MSEATLTIRWTCAHCNAEGEYETRWLLGSVLPVQPIPPGWRVGPAGPYCPAHELVVRPRGSGGEVVW